MGKNVYSVTQINTYIERMFQDDYMLTNLSISGEVSNCKYNHTGHIYFTLKDEKSSISCVMFAGNRAKGLRFDMKDGDQIVIAGYVGIYAAAGKYQVYARSIELAGVGDLYAKFEQLKTELEESGMFSEMYKKPIPTYATRIGVVTAPTGAAVHDIIQVSKRRNPYVQIVLYPAQVQGEAAKESIVNGISFLDQMELDVIIIGRGGGSIEDLWAFNEEVVAKAIFNASTPIISAVGHETDYTISDFVADRRAATPSQAAEIANFRYDDFSNSISRMSDRFNMSFDTKLNSYTERLTMYKRRIDSLRPENKIKFNIEKLNNLDKTLQLTMNQILSNYEKKLAISSSRLDAVSPAKKIAKGFGYLTTESGSKIDSVDVVSVSDKIVTRVSDGKIVSEVISVDRYNIGENYERT